MKIGIIDLCKQIEDPSMNRKKVHKMETSIYISIAAVICEVQSWNEIEEFGNSKIAFFKSRIPGLEFIPSHDTFNRFFSMIKSDYFEHSQRSLQAVSDRHPRYAYDGSAADHGLCYHGA